MRFRRHSLRIWASALLLAALCASSRSGFSADPQVLIGGRLYNLAGALTARPAAHGLLQVSIPTQDGLGEVAFEASTSDHPTAIVLLVHSFSGDENEITVDPARSTLLAMTDIAIVSPRLFGPAGAPQTCGSSAQAAHARDVVGWMRARYGDLPVFITAVSGGAGLAPVIMAANPGLIQGATLWSGYDDEATWFAESQTAGTVYWQLMQQTYGGPPNGALAAQYLARSPSGAYIGMARATIYINDPLLDHDILPHHRQDLRDQLLSLPATAGVIVNYIAYSGMGHGVDYPTVVAQINAMRRN